LASLILIIFVLSIIATDFPVGISLWVSLYHPCGWLDDNWVSSQPVFKQHRVYIVNAFVHSQYYLIFMPMCQIFVIFLTILCHIISAASYM
jgi:hypothetical protein